MRFYRILLENLRLMGAGRQEFRDGVLRVVVVLVAMLLLTVVTGFLFANSENGTAALIASGVLWIFAWMAAFSLGYRCRHAGIIALFALVTAAIEVVANQSPDIAINPRVPEVVATAAFQYGRIADSSQLVVLAAVLLALGWLRWWKGILVLWMFEGLILMPTSIVLSNMTSDSPFAANWVSHTLEYALWRGGGYLLLPTYLVLGLLGHLAHKSFERIASRR